MDIKEQLNRFVSQHADAFALAAEKDFKSKGPGCVVVFVRDLAGGEKLEKQKWLRLAYRTREHFKNEGDEAMVKKLDSLNFPEELMIAFRFPDKSVYVVTDRLAELKEIQGGKGVEMAWKRLPGGRMN